MFSSPSTTTRIQIIPASAAPLRLRANLGLVVIAVLCSFIATVCLASTTHQSGSAEPLVIQVPTAELLAEASSAPATSNTSAGQPELVSRTEKGGAQVSLWLIPRFVLDQRPGFSESTLWAVRNEEFVIIDVDVLYYDTSGAVITSANFSLSSRETRTRSLIDVAELIPPFTLASQARVEGYILISARRRDDPGPNDARISIDTFTIDYQNDFAGGGLPVHFDGQCRFWTARFVDFGSGPSSVDILTEALGTGLADPPTLRVLLYAEDSTFLGGFDIKSDKDVFTLDIGSLTQTNFGAAEIDFGDGRDGVVSVRHSAFNRFSVGHNAYCYQ